MNKAPEKKKITKPHLLSMIISGGILASLIAATIIFWQPLSELMGDPERAREVVAQAGPWGPVVFIALQVLQVIIAPIPGQVTGFAGGLLFGALWGTVFTMIGAAIGFTLIFILARKLGRPFVEYFVDKKLLAKFDYIVESNGVMVLFLIFLLPAFPDDIICYIAGLTTIKIRTLILISLLGRLPGNLLLSITGAGVAESNAQLVMIAVSFLALVAAVGFWQRKRLQAWIKKLAQKKEVEK